MLCNFCSVFKTVSNFTLVVNSSNPHPYKRTLNYSTHSRLSTALRVLIEDRPTQVLQILQSTHQMGQKHRQSCTQHWEIYYFVRFLLGEINLERTWSISKICGKAGSENVGYYA